MFIMGQTSRCCMVCLMPQSHVSSSLENLHFNMVKKDKPEVGAREDGVFD